MEGAQSPSGRHLMDEIKVQLDCKTMAALRKIADEQEKSVDEVATELFNKGLANFFAPAGPLSTH